MKNTLWVIVAIIVIGGGILFFSRPNSNSPSDATSLNTSDAGDVASEYADSGKDGDATAPVTPAGAADTAGDAVPASSEVFRTVTVTRSAQGFSPSVVTIHAGDTVHFVNQAGGSMWVASAVHPTHTLYAGTSLSEHCGNGAANDSFDQCDAGDDYSFTFKKTGEWKYHNHVNASQTGTVIVQ